MGRKPKPDPAPDDIPAALAAIRATWPQWKRNRREDIPDRHETRDERIRRNRAARVYKLAVPESDLIF